MPFVNSSTVGSRLEIKVSIEGVKIDALINTGAQSTIISHLPYIISTAICKNLARSCPDTDKVSIRAMGESSPGP